MKPPMDAARLLASRAGGDLDFRERLLANPKETVEEEFGVALAEGHEIHVHEETYAATHLVIPPRSKLTEVERREARGGAASLEFLRKTLHDPAPPPRPPVRERERTPGTGAMPEALAKAGRGKHPPRSRFPGIHHRREWGLALHSLQYRQSGHTAAFRKAAFRFRTSPTSTCGQTTSRMKPTEAMGWPHSPAPRSPASRSIPGLTAAR